MSVPKLRCFIFAFALLFTAAANAQAPRIVINPLGHSAKVHNLLFTPDGSKIVSISEDKTIRIWNAQTGEVQAELNSNRAMSIPIVQISFSPDGQYVATLTQDGKVHLWAATWKMLLQLARSRSLRQLTADECNHYLNLSASECPVLSLNDKE